MIPQKLPHHTERKVQSSSDHMANSFSSAYMSDHIIQNGTSLPPPSISPLSYFIFPHRTYRYLRLQYLFVCVFIVHLALHLGARTVLLAHIHLFPITFKKNRLGISNS